MSTQHVIKAEIRERTGTTDARQLRHVGKLPAVLYGAGKDNVDLVLDQNSIRHQLDVESFHSAILSIDTGKAKEKAILRDVQMHPFRAMVMHIDFQRINEKEKLHINVPLHFLGEEEAPGVRLDSGIVSHLMTDVGVSCLPGDLPEYLEIDLTELALHDSVHLSDIMLPDGIELTALMHDGEDQAVATVLTPKVVVEEETVEEETVEDGEASEEAAGEGE